MRNITRILYSTESYPYAMTASGRDEGGRGDQRRQPVSAPVTSSDTKCDPEHPATHHLRSGHQGWAKGLAEDRIRAQGGHPGTVMPHTASGISTFLTTIASGLWNLV